ncbi:putative acyl-activating enzyme 18, peroxisomal [Capsicum baccatum]|uniref:Acyl-activating enzyme 18, peroxisomal n=1 Tax=Capsicum baccatum TaxID=33114 RepID=A0A2G2W7F8_CAPBA|nr:putative acyl-activating enzyme 18, peroxisomal [Capsicum baccatum]
MWSERGHSQLFRSILKSMGNPVVQHNFREANKVADSLARASFSLSQFGEVISLQSPPSSVVVHLQNDVDGVVSDHFVSWSLFNNLLCLGNQSILSHVNSNAKPIITITTGNTSPLDYLSEFELISLMEKHDSLDLEHGACGNLDYIIVPCCGELRQSKSGPYHKPLDVPGIGELALGPLIFGASSTLLNADQNEIYLKGMPILNGKVLRRHGDVFERTSKGYYHAYGRPDDTINLGGIKVSSLEIERICNAVDENIPEIAVVGVPPIRGGPEKLRKLNSL